MAELFDFQDPVVGRKTDATQLRQVFDQPSHVEIVGVVDRGFGPQRGPFGATLVVLFEVRVFVVDVQGGDNPLGDNARPTSAVGGSLSLHLAGKDELHGFWSAQIDVLADDLLEKLAPMQGCVPDLGQGELALQDREAVAEARLAVGGGKGVRQPGQPLAEKALDLAFVEAVG